MTLQVEGTNDSSCLSKYSTAKSGYFKDEFLCHFVNKFSRRAPLIHLGYSVRAQIINNLVKDFVNAFDGLKQIVSLGAGFDTLFFKLKASLSHPNICYYELDLPRVVKKKTFCIKRSTELTQLLGEYTESEDSLVGDQYKLFAVDLRDIKAVDKLLKRSNLNSNVPTLFLSECAITYLEDNRSSELIQLAAGFSNASFLTYEQIHPDDGFGLIMTRHFTSLQSPLLSVTSYPSLNLQEQRYHDLGWQHCTCISALEAYNQLVPDTERQRVLHLEPFDEWEEFYLKCCHYAVVIASNGSVANWTKLCYNQNMPTVIDSPERKELNWSLEEMEDFSVYGHSVAWWGEEEDLLIVVGGWGEREGNAHGRLKQVTWLRREKEQWIVNRRTDTSVTAAMFATWTKLQSGKNQYVVYGGRSSPGQCVWSVPQVATVSATEPTTWQPLMSGQDPLPSPRYRHTAVLARRNDSDMFVVFGGRTTNLKLLNDTWMVSVDGSASKVMTLPSQPDQPCARHSHSAAVRTKDSCSDELWISGGLSDSGPLAELWCLQLASNQWWQLPVTLLPRFGHSSSVLGHQLLLVGGTNNLDSYQPGVAVINLETAVCVEYKLPGMNPGSCLLLINHCHVISKDGQTLWILGGGGNCFSFGTFFNKHSASINLKQLGL